jgi:hypothetical protein
LILQLPRKLLHHRGLARAAHREVADGDDLNAQRGIAQQPHVIKETPQLDHHQEGLRDEEQ